MLAKILMVTDLHKTYRDSSTIKNRLIVQDLIQAEIIDIIKEQGITHVIILGDWYDRGFHGLGKAWGQMELDKRLSDSVQGECYMCLGNHFYLERDENPEMYIIQPNSLIKPVDELPMPDKPLFKLVNELRIGTVQISFFHFSKLNKQYVTYRDPSVSTHIGIYHDDACVPGWVREMEGYVGSVSTTYLNDIYRNIDIAIHGHIHRSIGVISLDLNSGRQVPLYIPGALSITSNKDIYKHSSVELPIVTIEDDSSVAMSAVTVSTHLELLQFYTTTKKTVTQRTDVAGEKLFCSKTTTNSLRDYLTNKGRDQRDLDLIDAAASSSLTLAKAASIVQEVRV